MDALDQYIEDLDLDLDEDYDDPDPEDMEAYYDAINDGDYHGD